MTVEPIGIITVLAFCAGFKGLNPFEPKVVVAENLGALVQPRVSSDHRSSQSDRRNTEQSALHIKLAHFVHLICRRGNPSRLSWLYLVTRSWLRCGEEFWKMPVLG